MAIDFDQIETYVRRLVKKRLHSTYIQSKPLLFFIAGSRATNLDKLGDPKVGVILGGRNLGMAQREMLAGSYNHQVRYQKDETDDATVVTGAGSTPVASGFADDNIGLYETRWSHFFSPLKIRQSRLDNCKSNLMLASIVEEAVAMGMNKHLQNHQTELWNGSLNEAQQDAEDWGGYLGLTHAVDDGTTSGYEFYGGVDRTVQTQLQSKLVAASSIAASGTIIDLRMFRKVRTLNTFGGLANKAEDAGTLVITTGELWEKLANDAEGKHNIYDPMTTIPGVLNHTGMKYPVICKDQTKITYDEDCPAGTAFVLTPSTWVWEVQRGSNFKTEEWVKKYLTEEGGGYYRWTLLHTKARLTCTDPFLNVKITGLTTS